MTEAAIIAAVVVVILQIITLSLLRNTRKMVRELAEKKPANSFHNERRDRDMRQNNRHTANNDNRNRPQPGNTNSSTAAVDPVEKSLRDINLKLKNAERDQEFARKKVQDNFSKDQNRRRDNGRGGRDQRRGDRRSNWNDKNSRHENSRLPMDSQVKEESEEIKKSVELPVQEVPTSSPVVAPELIPNDFGSDDNMQHGRKFAPKRRTLPEENSQESVVSSSNEPAQEQFNQENNDSSEKTVESEIKFGRR